jgi:small-conductance mechanosensitive channel
MITLLEHLLSGFPDWARQAIVALAAGTLGAILALLVHRLVFRVMHRLASRTSSLSDDIVVKHILRPTRWAFVALGIVLAARQAPALKDFWDSISGFVMPLLVGWIAIAILNALVEAMTLHADISVEDNRRARRRRTRLAIFGRILTFVIIFMVVALMLFSVPGVAKVGATLMASAGLAALAVGAAAQPALKALIAGFQMALTEPISIDDVVILDGEWGRIEDIRTTYVVVVLWDQRRLVVPTNRFLEETFQNWTKTTSQLLGTVMLYLDHTVDVARLREEYTKQIEAHRLWDRRAQVLQVTDCREMVLEIRLLMSAKDGPTLFDLRCALRESMMDFIRRDMPEALSRRRQQAIAPLDAPPVTISPTPELVEMMTRRPG